MLNGSEIDLPVGGGGKGGGGAGATPLSHSSPTWTEHRLLSSSSSSSSSPSSSSSSSLSVISIVENRGAPSLSPSCSILCSCGCLRFSPGSQPALPKLPFNRLSPRLSQREHPVFAALLEERSDNRKYVCSRRLVTSRLSYFYIILFNSFLLILKCIKRALVFSDSFLSYIAVYCCLLDVSLKSIGDLLSV